MRFGNLWNPSLPAKVVTLFVMLTGFSGTASAGSAPLCSAIFTEALNKPSRVTLAADEVSPFTALQLEEHLSTIDHLLGPLQVPNETQVSVGSRIADSVFDRNTFKLYAGMKAEQNQIVILSHEYGHAILEKNLYHNLEAYRQFKPLAASLKADRAAGKPGVDRTQKLYAISSTLHEFFADVVAVTTHQNPHALSEVTRDPTKPFVEASWDDLITRDFVAPEGSPRRENWEAMRPLANFFGEVYYPLLPARWVFWDLVQTKMSKKSFRAKILPKVYKAVEKVMSEAFTWDEQKLGGKKLEPAMMTLLNERLIAELRASLK